MILALSLATSAALAAAPPTLTYEAKKGETDASAYRISVFVEKQALWVASTDAYLYAEGTGSAKQGRKVPVGSPVTVVAAGTAVEALDGMMNRWYQVTTPVGTGWMHGGALTPFGFTGDLDEDGETETALVSFNTDFSVRVTVIEPNPRAGAEAWLSVDAVGGDAIGVQGCDLVATFMRAKVASLPLVHVHVGVAADADFSDVWVSYRAPSAGEVGIVRAALTLNGHTGGSNSSTYEVKFDGKRKIATVKRHNKKDGKTEEKVNVWDVIDGVYHKEKDGQVVR